MWDAKVGLRCLPVGPQAWRLLPKGLKQAGSWLTFLPSAYIDLGTGESWESVCNWQAGDISIGPSLCRELASTGESFLTLARLTRLRICEVQRSTTHLTHLPVLIPFSRHI
jgi:hypothetical protein